MRRELVTINPETGATKLVGVVGKHIASIVFAQSGQGISLSISQGANGVTLTWSGSTGKFLIQKKNDLNSPTWINVQTTTARSVTLPTNENAAFFRIQDNYTGPDIP